MNDIWNGFAAIANMNSIQWIAAAAETMGAIAIFVCVKNIIDLARHHKQGEASAYKLPPLSDYSPQRGLRPPRPLKPSR